MIVQRRWRSLILAVTLTLSLLPADALSGPGRESGQECCRHGRAACCSSHCVRKGKTRAGKSETRAGVLESQPKQTLSCHTPKVSSPAGAEDPPLGLCIVSKCDRDPSPRLSFSQDLYLLGRLAAVPANTLLESEIHLNPASLATEAFSPPPDPPPQSC